MTVLTIVSNKIKLTMKIMIIINNKISHPNRAILITISNTSNKWVIKRVTKGIL